MARFDKGWVKIYRSAILGDIGSNYTRGGLFATLLGIANIQDSTVNWCGKPKKLEKGEIVTSIAELSALGEVDRRTVDRHLNYLRLRGTIEIEKSSSGTLIKIVNFEKYQSHDDVQAKPQRNDTLNDVAHIREGKKKRRKEEKEEAKIVSSLNELINEIGEEGFQDLFSIYPQDLIDFELPQMVIWLKKDPKKNAKENYLSFANNWLKKALKDRQETQNKQNQAQRNFGIIGA